jgi:hypothetical protein
VAVQRERKITYRILFGEMKEKVSLETQEEIRG